MWKDGPSRVQTIFDWYGPLQKPIVLDLTQNNYVYTFCKAVVESEPGPRGRRRKPAVSCMAAFWAPTPPMSHDMCDDRGVQVRIGTQGRKM
jgi:hypothetical protein